jgi:hypothetical protein
MFSKSEYERLSSQFNHSQKQRSAKLIKIWKRWLLLSIILLALSIGLLLSEIINDTVSLVAIIFFSVATIVTLLGTLVSLNYTSEKPYYSVLFSEIIEKINQDDGVYIQYESYPKDTKELIVRGGLFTRYASVNTKRHMSGFTSEQLKYDIFETVLTTSNGNSQTTHFNGVYFVINNHTKTTLQLRSNGRPKRKGVKYEKVSNFDIIKGYKLVGEHVNNTDQMFYQFMTKLKQKDSIKYVYLSVLNDETHLGIWYRKRPTKKVKKLSIQACNDYYNYFKSEIALINELANINPYK